MQLLIFDLLHVNEQSLLTSTYDERRQRLADLQLHGPNWQTPPAVDGAEATVLAASREQGLEGIVPSDVPPFTRLVDEAATGLRRRMCADPVP